MKWKLPQFMSSGFHFKRPVSIGRRFILMSNLGKRLTVSKATLGKLPRDGVERIWAFSSA